MFRTSLKPKSSPNCHYLREIKKVCALHFFSKPASVTNLKGEGYVPVAGGAKGSYYPTESSNFLGETVTHSIFCQLC